MKTPEQILDENFATQNLTGMVRDGVIKAMKEYAIQSVELDVNYKVAIADRNDFRGLYNETVQERNELREALKTCIDELMYESTTGHLWMWAKSNEEVPGRLLEIRKLLYRKP